MEMGGGIMATHRLPIMGATVLPDATGECFMDNINNQMALATGLMRNLVMTFKDPSADCGFYGTFQVPQNYVGTAVLKILMVLDGTVGATSVDFEFSYRALADNESVEQGWQASETGNTGNTNGWANEDLALCSITLTDANFAVGDEVFFYLKRDFGTDDFVGDVHVVGVYFDYADA
jgi:hypothetical protein